HERFLELLAAERANIDGAYYSYGHPDGTVAHFSGPSLDRKPGPYNIFVAAAQLDLDREGSWMIGDRQSDIACARAAGLRPILLAPSGPASGDDVETIRAADLPAAVDIILEQRSRDS